MLRPLFEFFRPLLNLFVLRPQLNFLDRLNFCTVPRTLLNFLGHFEFFRPLWILDHLNFLQFLVIFAVLAFVAGPRSHTCINCDCTVIWLYFHSMVFTLARWRKHYLVKLWNWLWWPYMYLLAFPRFQIVFVVGVLSKFWALMLKFPTWHLSGHSARNLRK